MPNNPIELSCVLILYLVDHPGSIVTDHDTEFKFDPDLKQFMCRKQKNKVRNGWVKAGGLQHLFDYLPRIPWGG